MSFDYDFILNERKINPAIKLLHSDNLPLILGFLYSVFKQNNRITIPSSEIEINLIDYIHSLRMKFQNETLYPDKPMDYLTKWADDGYLRAYYGTNNDIPIFELSASTEKVIGWLTDLQNKDFIGTESRLKHIFEILKTLSYKTSSNTEKRLALLLKDKEEIQKKIDKLRVGEFEELTETQIKEYFIEAKDTANRLLGDFADVKDKFRKINQDIKEKQIQSYNKKGKILDDMFSMQDSIMQTDQGQSFKSFWEFLISSSTIEEFEDTLKTVCDLQEVKQVNKDDFMIRLKNHLVEAGSKVNQTKGELAEQLRRFLDEKTFQENRRVRELIGEIKTLSLKLKDDLPTEKDFFLMDDKPEIQIIMDRPNWKNSETISITDDFYEEGNAYDSDVNILYTQHFVDEKEIIDLIQKSLQNKSQISLNEITNEFPLTKGISEVVAYFSIASKYLIDNKAIIDETKIEALEVFNKKTDKYFTLNIPRLLFLK